MTTAVAAVEGSGSTGRLTVAGIKFPADLTKDVSVQRKILQALEGPMGINTELFRPTFSTFPILPQSSSTSTIDRAENNSPPDIVQCMLKRTESAPTGKFWLHQCLQQ